MIPKEITKERATKEITKERAPKEITKEKITNEKREKERNAPDQVEETNEIARSNYSSQTAMGQRWVPAN